MARRGAALADIKTTDELRELLKVECLHGMFQRLKTRTQFYF